MRTLILVLIVVFLVAGLILTSLFVGSDDQLKSMDKVGEIKSNNNFEGFYYGGVFEWIADFILK